MIKLHRVHQFIKYFIWITLLAAIVGAIFERNWIVIFISFIALALTFLPQIIERAYKVDIPLEFEILVVIFIYASIFLGEVKSYYAKFWWWDALLHTGSGIALGFVGFAILLVLYRGKKIKASPRTIALFTFSFAVAMGAVWEIFEFSMDQLVGTNMQKKGLVDTMWDLIVDAVGALFASLIGYIYLKKGAVLIFDKLIKKFLTENSSLIK